MRREKEKERDKTSRESGLLLISLLDQAQEWICVCFWFVFAELREKNGKRERDGRERREIEELGKRETEKTKGNRGNKDRKTKELIMGFKCRENRNRFWVFMTFNDIY